VDPWECPLRIGTVVSSRRTRLTVDRGAPPPPTTDRDDIPHETMDIGLLLRLERVAIEVEEEIPFQRTIGTVDMGLPHRTDRTIIHITTVGVVVVVVMVHPHRDDGNVEALPDITMMDEEDHRHRAIIEEEEEDHSGEVMLARTIPSRPSTVQGVP
jgi:hypothetical protein